MPENSSFDHYSDEYDRWYEENQLIYQSELNAIKALIPPGLVGVEVGVGTGRFAIPLGIKIGVEPAPGMARIARQRGIQVLEGVAENLPLGAGEYDYVLMVTAICFFSDVPKAFAEAHRVLQEKGLIVVAFIDRESELGQHYERSKSRSKFYQNARFYSTQEVTEFLQAAGFGFFQYRQTVFSKENRLHLVEPGYGRGGFVVIRAEKRP